MTDATKAIVANGDDKSKRDHRVPVRFNERELELANAVADDMGLALSSALRALVLAEARKRGCA